MSNNGHALPLTGLYGTHPLGALAAFGLLRVLSHRSAVPAARLSWDRSAGYAAVLHSAEPIDRDRLLESLADHMRGRANAAFLKRDDIKLPPEKFVAFCDEVTDSADDHEEAMAFLAAYGSELATARSTGDVKPTAFHMTAGQQRFLKSARELAASLDQSQSPVKKGTADGIRSEIRDAFGRALFGPWLYKDEFHSLGLDPATEALYALSDRAPTSVKPTSERAAVWLAFESLPLFPTLAVPSGVSIRLHTRGFDERATRFRWPLWNVPVSIAAVGSLIGLRDIHEEEPDSVRLAARGISAVYEGACFRDGNGRGTLRNARLIAAARLTAPNAIRKYL